MVSGVHPSLYMAGHQASVLVTGTLKAMTEIIAGPDAIPLSGDHALWAHVGTSGLAALATGALSDSYDVA